VLASRSRFRELARALNEGRADYAPLQDESFMSGPDPLLKAILFSANSTISPVWCVDTEFGDIKTPQRDITYLMFMYTYSLRQSKLRKPLSYASVHVVLSLLARQAFSSGCFWGIMCIRTGSQQGTENFAALWTPTQGFANSRCYCDGVYVCVS